MTISGHKGQRHGGLSWHNQSHKGCSTVPWHHGGHQAEPHRAENEVEEMQMNNPEMRKRMKRKRK